jgi:Tol biopolymer transport system component
MAVLIAVCASTAHAGSAAAPVLAISADRLPSVSGEIYRVDLDGHRADLSRSPFADTQPFVSPDGKRVAFVSDRTGAPAVYVVGVDGRGLARISRTVGQPSIVGWSPDSRYVAVRTSSYSTKDAGLGHAIARLWVLEPGHAQRLAAAEGDTFDPCGIIGAAWSPAADVIAFAGCSDLSAADVRVVTPDGRPVLRAVSQKLGGSFTWSRTGSLAYLSAGTMRTYDARGRLLARFASSGAAWSPSGDRLASMAGGVLEVRVAGAGRPTVRMRLFPAKTVRSVVRIFHSFAPELVWADGRHLAVGNVSLTIQTFPPSAAVPNAGADVIAGKRWHPSLQSWVAGSCGCATADGSLLVRAVKTGDVFVLRVSAPDGSRARTLETVPGCLNDGGLVPAATGVQFARHSVVYGTACDEAPANLYVLDGRKLHRLTTTTSQQTDPVWSPDGTKIAFVQSDGKSCRGCPSSIWSVDADGASPHALTTAEQSTWDTRPSWSPDGTQLVFSHSTISGPSRLFTVSTAGGAPNDLHVPGANPSWGPTRIAYLAGLEVGGPHVSVATMAPDGSDRRTVATGYLLSPAWSRDGRLAYLEQPPDGGRSHVDVVDGTATHRFALPFAQVHSVSWMPDGRLAIVAQTLATSPFDVYSFGVDGRKLTRVTTNLGVFGVDAR